MQHICLRGIFFNPDDLSKCINWSSENNRCKGIYDKSILCNPSDIWQDCKGFANMQLCPYYAATYFSKSDIKRFREFIRKNVMYNDEVKEDEN